MATSVLSELPTARGAAGLLQAVRTQTDVSALPLRYCKSLDCARLAAAQLLYDALVVPEDTTILDRLRHIYINMPWQALRMASKSSATGESVRKLLGHIWLSRPFGSKSVLEKLASFWNCVVAVPNQL